MQEHTSAQAYQQQSAIHKAQLAHLLQQRSNLGWWRLGVFAATALLAYKIFVSYGVAGVIPTIAGLASLLYLVSVDVANNIKIRNTKTLIRINDEELQVLQHQFTDREEGALFIPAEHPYAADLDIFGKASLYQYINRCYTEQGQQRLANNLLQPASPQLALARQEAIKEFGEKLEERQQWQAYAMQTTITAATESRISMWAGEEKKHFTNPAWKMVVIVYSTVMLGAAIAAMVGYISGTAFSALYLLSLIASTLLSRSAAQPYQYLNGIVKETATLQDLVGWLEAQTVAAPHLQALQEGLAPSGLSASNALKKLKTILDRFDLRNSILGVLFFNSFLLWDVRQMIALNAWRKSSKALLPKWFAAVAEMEVLHSLSTLYFNQPAWCFPQFSSQHFALHGIAIGHPLLRTAQRVNNDFDLEGMAKIALITGSNMAGKSTFLRSLGVNIVLAQTGAPVCAASFALSPVQLMSSMRIADNLAENTSTFYAELKKLRTIIEAVKAHQNIFILLDEILRGTNSYDRHKGSAALIKQLIKEDAVAVMATHDVELAGLQTTYPTAIENYHFDVEVEGEELYFDYKLKDGVCKSLNASILMKKIGIDLD